MKKILMFLMTLGLFVSYSKPSKGSIKTKDYLIEAVNASSEYGSFLKEVETTRGTEAKSFADKEMRDFIVSDLVKLGLKEEYPSLEKLKEALDREPLIGVAFLLNMPFKMFAISLQLEQKFPIEGNENKEQK